MKWKESCVWIKT